MVEKAFAAIGLLACIGMLLWMLLGARRRDTLRHAAHRGLRWRSHRRVAKTEAAKVIERARHSVVDRQGNVYRPKSFNGREQKDKRRD